MTTATRHFSSDDPVGAQSEADALEALADEVSDARAKVRAAARLIADTEEAIEAVQIVLDARRKATGLIK